MSKYFISINPFAEFSASSKSAQKRIIKQQNTPNKLLIQWYQLAKGALKRYFADIDEYTPIEEAIEALGKKVPQSKWQLANKMVSIEALRKISSIKKPPLLSKIRYELISAEKRDLIINDVDIRIAPDVIFKGTYQGETIYGAVKFHISKSKPFNLKQCQMVSTLLFQFLKKNMAQNGEKVLPELCLCLDVFGERLAPAPLSRSKETADIKKICDEIKRVWDSNAR